eukprot:gene12990-7641_t
MSEIDFSEIQNKDENDFIELNEEKTNKTETKPKRKYKKREPKVKKIEENKEIETNNEINQEFQFKNDKPEIPNEYFNQIFEQIKEEDDP